MNRYRIPTNEELYADYKEVMGEDSLNFEDWQADSFDRAYEFNETASTMPSKEEMLAWKKL